MIKSAEIKLVVTYKKTLIYINLTEHAILIQDNNKNNPDIEFNWLHLRNILLNHAKKGNK